MLRTSKDGDSVNVIADLEPYLVRRWLDGDESVTTELVEDFWDRQYARKFGLALIPAVRLPVRPEPDPSPEILFALQNEVMANVVGWLANDPDPEPNRTAPMLRGRNLVAVLSNRAVRLKSAKAVRDRTLQSLKALESEIARLSTSVKASSE